MLRPRAAALAALCALAVPAGALASESFGDDPTNWHETVAPHFLFEHESVFAPGGMTLDLERIHNRLRMDLSMFAPWMSRQRLKLYLYLSQGTFLRGRFHPPPWSNGLAFYETRTVTSFMMPSRVKLLQVLSHETTHVLFESYWGAAGKTPPAWLNEGLAMMEEGGAVEGVPSDWEGAIDAIDPAQLMPLSRLASITPTRDLHDDQQSVTLWYIEAFGAVRFLYRGHSRMQFYDFCSRLRDGASLQQALWTVYRFRDPVAFDRAFRATLGHSGRHLVLRAAPAAAPPSPSRRGPALKAVGFQSIGFKDLMPEDKGEGR